MKQMYSKSSILMLICKTIINMLAPGLILCVLYPYIHAVFLTAAKDGYIPYILGIKESIAISWICMIVFRTQIVTSNYYSILNKFDEIKGNKDGNGSGPIS